MTYTPEEVMALIDKCLEPAPLVPYDPSVPQDVMSEMYRDMENTVKGWEACRTTFLMNLKRELGLPQ